MVFLRCHLFFVLLGCFFWLGISADNPLFFFLYNDNFGIGAVGREEEEDLCVHQASGDGAIQRQGRGMQTSLVSMVRVVVVYRCTIISVMVSPRDWKLLSKERFTLC